MAVNASLDVARIKKDFPILDRVINGTRLVYLDSAATSQKPRQVLDAMERYYETCNANVHRSVYQIAGEATEAYETARLKVKRFINAPSEREVVFTKNATEGLNLVAYSWGRTNLREGDVVVLTHMEHHANIVPWHILAAERGIVLRWVPLTPEGLLDLTDLDSAARRCEGVRLRCDVERARHDQPCSPARATPRTRTGRWRSSTRVSTCRTCRPTSSRWAPTSSRSPRTRCAGPTGIGVLWGREELLDAMPPFLGGGDMILDVRLDGYTPNELPVKFEAGTPPIAEAIGLGAAVDYLTELGMTNVRQHEMAVTGLRDRLGSPSGSATTSRSSARATSRSGAAHCPSRSVTCIPTTSRRSSTRRTCACVRATTAQSR